ncbi:unnamed protein product [Echinostoma caproni]|uniref:NIBRIN_BRCT_II domain-containing protein n=1 Tax=Echinostoma caproni TaxID=27848 RepID=A0A183AVP5_9TREM|nr:unnamed protein product [Echinostoma caproni]
MGREIRQRIKTLISLFNGEIVNDLNDTCELLIMPSVVVTTKVVCALLAQVPIVTPTYMEKFLEASSRIPFVRPNEREFLPNIKEDRLTCADSFRFYPDHKRTTLFVSKVFYTLNHEQFSQLQNMVHLGGGEIRLLNSMESATIICKQIFPTAPPGSNDEILRLLLAQPCACLIHAKPNRESRDWQRVVYCALKAVQRRPILESELGFAVIYVSTESYCNPDKKCPDKLYQEASISQAFSINPFHLDSQPDDRILKEQQSRGPSLKRATRQVSVQKLWLQQSDEASHLAINKLSELQEEPGRCDNQEPQRERPRPITNIMPPVPIVQPKRNPMCLVPDTEALNSSLSPANRTPSTDQVIQVFKRPTSFFNQSSADTIHLVTSESPTLTPKEKPTSSAPTRETTAFIHNTRVDLVAEDDLLAALDSMPALASIVPHKCSPSTSEKSDMEIGFRIIDTNLCRSPPRALSGMGSLLPVTAEHSDSKCTFATNSAEPTLNHANPVVPSPKIKPSETGNCMESQLVIWSSKKSTPMEPVNKVSDSCATLSQYRGSLERYVLTQKL